LNIAPRRTAGSPATDTALQSQARALGDPTRHAIFRHIVQAGAPVGIADLNAQFPLNHNAIRQHLAKLVDAGLVIESTAASSGRGRPRLVYEASPSAEGKWGVTGPYERLSRLLAEIIRTGRSAHEVGRAASAEFRVPSPSGDVVADLAAAMARQGFEPEVRARAGGAEIVLQACPFASAALVDRDTVCALHLGIAEGLANDPHAVVTELVARDPRSAQCRIRLRFATEPDKGHLPGELVLRGRVNRP